MKKLEYLVVGTGRCGTAYMAQLLTSAGIPCGHESVFSTNTLMEIKNKLKNPKSLKLSKCSLMSESKWVNPRDIIADSSYLSAPYLKSAILKNTKIIHVVRHPLDVIKSFVFDGLYFDKGIPENSQNYQNFIKRKIPEIYNNNFNSFTKAALYYILWNKLIEKNIQFYENYFLYNIESNPNGLLNFLGKKKYNKKLSKKINTWKKNDSKFYLKNIDNNVLKQLKEFSLRYNYYLVKI
jgi:hypothetical protein